MEELTIRHGDIFITDNGERIVVNQIESQMTRNSRNEKEYRTIVSENGFDWYVAAKQIIPL